MSRQLGVTADEVRLGASADVVRCIAKSDIGVIERGDSGTSDSSASEFECSVCLIELSGRDVDGRFPEAIDSFD